jgi:cyclophilin family peptidyl-prolyl cis-trans isomerase
MSEINSNKQSTFIVLAIVAVLGLGIGTYFYRQSTSLPENEKSLVDSLRKDDQNSMMGYDQNQDQSINIGGADNQVDQYNDNADADGTEQATQNSDNIQNMNMNDATSKTQTPKPEMLIDKTKQYTAVLKTSEGDITVKLNADSAPNTVNNFVYLARRNYYSDTIFHRVMKGFMIQGGDPLGNGTGGPGYEFDDEPFTGEYKRGTIAMANAGANTNGSQFFIMHADYPLPKNYIIFGSVTEGLDVVDKIATAEVRDSGFGEVSTPVKPVKVTSVTIEEK